MKQSGMKLTVALLSALNAIAGAWLFIEYFIYVEPEYRDPVWIVLTFLQVGLLIATVILLYRVSVKAALFATIGVILVELAVRIPSTIEEVSAYPDVVNIGLVSVPVIGLLAIEYEWPNSYEVFQSWFVDLAVVGELVSLALLIVLLRNTKQAYILVEKTCTNCSATSQKGNFCSKCGAKI